jgi:lysophospholipase L1-like esterase
MAVGWSPKMSGATESSPRSLTGRKVAFLASGVLLLVVATVATLYFRFALPTGRGPAGPALGREAFAKPWSARSILVVGLGDSVTAGFGARKGYGYFDRVITNAPEDSAEVQRLSLAAVLPNLQFTNLAVSGSTSAELIKDQLAHLPTAGSNVLGIVLITTGGNDLIHNYGRTPPRDLAMYGAGLEQARPWISNFEKRIEEIIKEVSSRFPGGCHIYLANIYDPSDGVGDLRKAGMPPWPDGVRILGEYNRLIAQTAARHPHVHLVNIHDLFLGHGLYCTHFWRAHYDRQDAHYWYYSNLEDPNERGYDAIRRLFLIKIAESAEAMK